MPTHVIHANITDTITVACEACHRSKTFPVALVKDRPQPLKVRCACGAVFAVTVVIRAFYRKKTHLPGTYARRALQTDQILEHGRMIVEDLSRTGLGFRPLQPHHVHVQDVLLLTFTLDDPPHTVIREAIRVRRIDDGVIGGEFLDHDAYTETKRILGFYLMPR
jgi:hypothetical protein